MLKTLEEMVSNYSSNDEQLFSFHLFSVSIIFAKDYSPIL